jgi:Mn2+/Fe2+ NRAMP family transporter
MTTIFSITKWKSLFVSLLPGLFLVGYNIGTGSITSMAKGGANFGLDLLWTVLLSCLATYYLILLFSRYSMATGETVLYGIRKHIHPFFAVVLIIFLSPIILVALMGVLGIVAESLSVWSGTWNANTEKIPAEYMAIVLSILCYIILWDGRFQPFQKILVLMLTMMGATFFFIAVLYFPSISELVWGFVPKLPAAAENSDTNSLVITAGMIGTTVSVFAFLIRSGSVVQAGWKMENETDWKQQRRDAGFCSVLMFLLSAAILLTASATLHERGLKMNSISEMVYLMEPIAGSFATTIFVIGIVAAGLSSHMPNLLVIPWMIQDYRGERRMTGTIFYRIFVLLLSIFATAGTLFHFKPISLMILSQACIAIMLPLTLAAVIYLTSQKKIMGQYVNHTGDYIILGLILVFTIYMGFIGISGIVSTFLGQ